ncbi:MAG: hypothetical protein NT027_10280 [Proteobacteria bacterium]|nr:hypothetical protein [Pseudomonadota bacterium]
MFSLFKSRKKKSKSILSGQRPSKRRSKSRHQSILDRFGLIPIAVIVCICFIIVLGLWSIAGKISSSTQNYFHNLQVYLQLPPPEWNIQIVDPNGVPLSDDIRREIFKQAQKVTRNRHNIDQSQLIQTIGSLGMFEKISIVRPQFQTVVIGATVRVPIMTTMINGQLRLVTEEGHIYGSSSQLAEKADSQSLVEVSGIIEKQNADPDFDVTQKMRLSPDESSRLGSAITLRSQALKMGLVFNKIEYQGYRGFSLNMTDSSEIVLGVGPFEYKLEKLAGILTKLKAQGITAARIELDYDGKAFIKERKF